jgi:membrane-bound ClpP family serine protease
MYEALDLLQAWHAGEILIGLSVVLILIDYFFPTDVPCHFGYFCFAAGMFFLLPLNLVLSLAASVAIWIVLGVSHQVWFRRFLAVAEADAGTGASRAARNEDA